MTSCRADDTSGYTSEIVEVYSDRKMLKTEEPMYFAWQVEGSTLYLHKTNPSDPEPALPASWWQDSTVAKFALTRKN